MFEAYLSFGWMWKTLKFDGPVSIGGTRFGVDSRVPSFSLRLGGFAAREALDIGPGAAVVRVRVTTQASKTKKMF